MAIERFLIVDEADANVLFFEMLLKDLGFPEVKRASTGAEGLDLIEACQTQFLVVAWELASMPGTLFLQKVRSNRKRKHMPFLIYSKRMAEQDIRLMKDFGVENVLAMPFDKAKASEMIKQMVEREDNLPQLEKSLRKMEGYIAENKPAEALKLVDINFDKKGPLYTKAQTLLGETWTLINNMDKAEKSLRNALEEDKNYAPAIQLLAKIYSKTGRLADAIVLLETLTQSQPKNISALFSLGSTYVDADQHDKAKKTMGQISILDEGNKQVNDSLGQIAFKEGDMTLAAKLLKETENGDELARSFNNMAIAMVAKNDFKKGISTYEAAIKILKDRAKLHLLQYNLGLAWKKNGKLTDAFSNFAQSYIAEPTFEKAYAAIARIVKELAEKGQKPDENLIKEVKASRQRYLATKPSPAPAEEEKESA